MTVQQTDTLQNLTYHYDKFGNLAARKDNKRNLTETFTYDNLNRLKTTSMGGLTASMTYDNLGRMTGKQDIVGGGQAPQVRQVFSAPAFDATKIHAMVEATAEQGVFPQMEQIISYTSFDKVKYLGEGKNRVTYLYGFNRQRIASKAMVNDVIRGKTYIGNCEFVTENNQQKTLTYLTGPYGVFAVVEQQNGEESVHFVLKDHLGSWTTITDEYGNVEREQSYDAWGNMRDPETWLNYSATEQVAGPMFDRGYTGHEHMTAFGLINMNGRCYDPVTSSFLSVDKYVSQPDNSQSFNRYAYCLNNPLRYTDPSGWKPIGGLKPNNPFHDNWSASYSRHAYEPRDFGILQLSDVNPDIAWMEANDMHGGCSFGSCQNGFYDSKGNYLGSDGKNGNKVYVLRSEIPSVMANMTEITRFFEKGVSSLTIDEIYGSFVEILPSRVGRYRMYDIVSQDNGKGGVAECNNREYGGFINEVGMVIELPHGEPKIPSNNKVTIDFPHGKEYATFHSHPSGNGASYIKDGEIRTPIFQQYPTEDDIGITGNHICYVFGRRDGNVYVYNGQGVQTIIRASDFISFTKFRRP